jgi:hypothetical protein
MTRIDAAREIRTGETLPHSDAATDRLISFDLPGGIRPKLDPATELVLATDIARAFPDKNFGDWLGCNRTRDLAQAVAKTLNANITSLAYISIASSGQTTIGWVHFRLVSDYCRVCSPALAVACDDVYIRFATGQLRHEEVDAAAAAFAESVRPANARQDPAGEAGTSIRRGRARTAQAPPRAAPASSHEVRTYFGIALVRQETPVPDIPSRFRKRQIFYIICLGLMCDGRPALMYGWTADMVERSKVHARAFPQVHIVYLVCCGTHSSKVLEDHAHSKLGKYSEYALAMTGQGAPTEVCVCPGPVLHGKLQTIVCTEDAVVESVWDGHSFMTSREFRGLDAAGPSNGAPAERQPAMAVTSEVLVEREKTAQAHLETAQAQLSFVKELVVAGHTLADVRAALDQIQTPK